MAVIDICMGFMTLVTAVVLCVRSQDSVLPVSVRRIHVAFSTAGWKGAGKLYHKTRETATLWRYGKERRRENSKRSEKNRFQS